MDVIPEWGRSSGGAHGNPVPYCCLENPTDRGAWWSTVHRVAKSRTRLKRQRVHARMQLYSINTQIMTTQCNLA